MKKVMFVNTLLLLVGLRPGPSAQQQNMPQFRATADLVSIDVSVRNGNNPVLGLTASDFTLSDNGLPQQIRAVTIDAVPLDVTLMVDLSSTQAVHLEQYRADVLGAVKLLRPADRFRLLTFARDVFRAVEFQAPDASIPTEFLQTGSLTAVHEALVAALMHRIDSDRRHLVVAFTDGYDNVSALPASTVQAVARRADAVLHLVIPSLPSPSAMLAAYDSQATQPYPSLLRGEFHPRFQATLVDAAEDTGGYAHKASGRGSQASMLPAFKQIIEEYRSSYLLQYQLAAAPRAGWHDVKVGVTRRGRHTVRARRGYFIGN